MKKSYSTATSYQCHYSMAGEQYEFKSQCRSQKATSFMHSLPIFMWPISILKCSDTWTSFTNSCSHYRYIIMICNEFSIEIIRGMYPLWNNHKENCITIIIKFSVFNAISAEIIWSLLIMSVHWISWDLRIWMRCIVLDGMVLDFVWNPLNSCTFWEH